MYLCAVCSSIPVLKGFYQLPQAICDGSEASFSACSIEGEKEGCLPALLLPNMQYFMRSTENQATLRPKTEVASCTGTGTGTVTHQPYMQSFPHTCFTIPPSHLVHVPIQSRYLFYPAAVLPVQNMIHTENLRIAPVSEILRRPLPQGFVSQTIWRVSSSLQVFIIIKAF